MGSSLRVEGVAAILEDVRQATVGAMKERIEARRVQGRLDISDEEADSLATIAGVIARTAAANGIAEAYQSGINQAATQEDHERPTAKVPSRLK